MAYDNLHNIVSKKQHIEQKDVQFSGTLRAGYELAYNYANTQQLSAIADVNYRTDDGPRSRRFVIGVCRRQNKVRLRDTRFTKARERGVKPSP